MLVDQAFDAEWEFAEVKQKAYAKIGGPKIGSQLSVVDFQE